MKNLMIVLAILPSFTFSQYTISGKVKSKTNGEALTGAVITVANSFIAVQSDLEGNYVLKNLKAGDYIISAGLLGYEKWKDKNCSDCSRMDKSKIDSG